MRIVEVTFRNRNDFKFIAACKHCGEKSRHGDGYADAYYQDVVFPHRHCEHCSLDEFGASDKDDKSTMEKENLDVHD